MKKIVISMLVSFALIMVVGGFTSAGKVDVQGSKELMSTRVNQTTKQFEDFSNCQAEEAEEEMAIWNPVSVSPSSGCIASGCGGSVCLISGCTGSVCFGSGCGGSVCGASGCGASGCAGSACGGSGCTGSACTGSACAGSVCVGSACAGSACLTCK